MSSPYDAFAEAYDTAMGDRKESATAIQLLLKEFSPTARSVIELGCGTGSLLKILRRRYAVCGLDLSARMVRVAKRKVPDARVMVGDITSFALREQFDAVVCAFDTMNHLPSFTHWREVMKRAREHLRPDGVFIFDINTSVKLTRYAEDPPFAEVGDAGSSIFRVKRRAANRFEITVQVFRHLSSRRSVRNEVVIPELTVPTATVRTAALRWFREVRVIDLERRRPTNASEELYFVCRSPR
jgi:SAM-dependent methyltransferase